MKKRGHLRRDRVDLDDIMYGIRALNEALSAGEPLKKIYLAEDKRRDPFVRRLLARADELQVPVRFERHDFFARFPYKAHQNVVAYAAPFPYITLEEAIASRKPGHPALFVVLDHVTDPHNAGAIIRTAECAGADAVVVPERRAAGVNGTVRKAAAGATEHVPVARVANVADALRKLKRAGAWVVGADLGSDALLYTQADLARDLAVVIGAEGTGLSQIVRRECDYFVRVPLEGKVESLNASVAAGIVLYEALRQRAEITDSSRPQV
ncbi:MAG: 23S rRNA (guanosine(2251)-2'-O)-methyltransferase RlmB [Candidatus Eremiobacteraeota bacterium]|nr:23S rRNA (guanosine(2251)-2'-O)-methyltransferase RlmB [Candidatus Eremiobacteraeota bacterium]